MQQYDYDSVARMHRVSKRVVELLVKKMSKNKQFISELWDKDVAQAHKEDAIERKADHFMLVDRPIFKVAEIR